MHSDDVVRSANKSQFKSELFIPLKAQDSW